MSASANAADIKALELWRDLAGQRLDTLASDLAALAARMYGMVRRNDYNNVVADVARLKEVTQLPDNLSDYSADHFLTEDRSDLDHADWLARIEEGVRFPSAQTTVAQILLLNQYESKVVVKSDGLMLPTYTDLARVSVLGNDDPVVSLPGEIVAGEAFYSYDDKYAAASQAQLVIPAELPPETVAELQRQAVAAFKAIDGAGLARADFFVRASDGQVLINELNTMPGFTSISMYPKLWDASGLGFSQLLERLVELALERQQDRARNRTDRG